MSSPKHIGMITPSSNTMLEPITSEMIASLPRGLLSVHYTRFVVKVISLDPNSLNQFTDDVMVDAARLLADAKMDVIAWNGTSGAWRGIAADEAICRSIQQATGVPATTSTFAQVNAFRAMGINRYALAVPYVDDLTEAIIKTYAGAGFTCVRSATLGISVNTEFAYVDDDTIRDLIRRSDHPDAEAIAVICTNFPAAYVVEEMERELGKPILDSTVITLWETLNAVGLNEAIPGWGRLLARQY